MDDYQVVIRPLVTEQGMHFANVRGAYPFEVARKANKVQIKEAIEKLYNVKVEKVNLVITSKGLKKAFVKLTSENQASDLAIRLGIF